MSSCVGRAAAYESQLVVLTAKLAEAQERNQGEAQANITAVFESALTASRAKRDGAAETVQHLDEKVHGAAVIDTGYPVRCCG